MNLRRKIELLTNQIDDGNLGTPRDFDGWLNRTEVVLRSVFGADSAMHKKFAGVSYSPDFYYEGMDISGYQPQGVREVISILEAGILEAELADEDIELAVEIENVITTTETPEQSAEAARDGRVFIVHGHNGALKHELARFLVSLTGHEPVILHEQANNGRSLIEKFENNAATTGYAVVLLTADDLGRAKDADADRPRGRQNVIFEMGFFFGALGRRRVAVLYEEGVEEPGDVTGLVYIPIDSAGGWRLNVARELSDAGIPVSWEALAR
ncbi:nucleotide-binding protein [Cryobacterium sp. TMT2-15-1]|uniref:TIR domain-containing protein n=1 Tax=Cryobacterium sp. TMT2-15-1 TaxID=1259246 RepID=UPI00106AED9E|nr:nucleotide-binding protein [Cryobacterium sp. TMT2-15-1]TFC56891.1 nucleotide-binding protein [Cryobacterium sp. TMT2-15-1]